MMTGERAVLRVMLCLLSGGTVLSKSAQPIIGVVVQGRSYDKPKILTPTDFTFKEDGVLQKISNVQLAGSSGDANKPGAGLVVLLLDESEFLPQTASGNSSPNARAASIATTISTVLRQLPVEARVAIYSTDYRLHQVRDFSFEEGTKPIFQPLSSEQVTTASKGYIKKLISAHDRISLNLEDAAKFQLAQLESIANHLANIPGRKALVWFCDPISFRTPPGEDRLYYPWFAAMRAVQRANLAIYPVECGSSQLPEVARMAEITGG